MSVNCVVMNWMASVVCLNVLYVVVFVHVYI